MGGKGIWAWLWAEENATAVRKPPQNQKLQHAETTPSPQPSCATALTPQLVHTGIIGNIIDSAPQIDSASRMGPAKLERSKGETRSRDDKAGQASAVQGGKIRRTTEPMHNDPDAAMQSHALLTASARSAAAYVCDSPASPEGIAAHGIRASVFTGTGAPQTHNGSMWFRPKESRGPSAPWPSAIAEVPIKATSKHNNASGKVRFAPSLKRSALQPPPNEPLRNSKVSRSGSISKLCSFSSVQAIPMEVAEVRGQGVEKWISRHPTH